MSRSTSGSSAAAAAANGSGRSAPIKANSNPLLPTSPIKQYVSNLRLLDLDRRSDWPGITVQTFSAKNADQKQRIGGVEWSLFRLFEIWDPHETSQKLQPFFPPLEPLQSLNLRAALYRCLNDLKKNGVLGRESVLRKTMLDECKGDKFFEVLAVFANAVLKKVISSRRSPVGEQPVARRLATATALSTGGQASLIPLAIAHKAALVNLLKKKDAKRRQFSDFEALLQARAATITQSIHRCKATPTTEKSAVPEKDAAVIKRQLTTHWIGDRTWLEALLYGDGVQVEDAFLSMHFYDVLSMVQRGHKPQDALSQTGLVEGLQLRVQEQQKRLRKWKKFHGDLVQEKPSPKVRDQPSRTAAADIKFDDHLRLQLSSAKSTDRQPRDGGPLRSDYEDILTDLDAELLDASQVVYQKPIVPVLPSKASPVRPPGAAMQRKYSKPDLDRKQSSQTMKEKASNLASRLKRPTVETNRSRAQHLETTVQLSPIGPRRAPVQSPPAGDDGLAHGVSESTTTQSHWQEPHPSAQPFSTWPSEAPVLPHPALRPEDALAEHIISSIGDATPSPVKKQPSLSLSERARLSMGHKPSFELITESPDRDSPQLPEAAPEQRRPMDRQSSLIERTRLSMATMSLHPPSSQVKDKRGSRSRESLYPVNQFDTPRSRRSVQAIESSKSGDSTPKEVLFSDDIDYEHVFKSRPRVAHSPIFSPAQDERNDGDSGQFDALDIEAYDDEDYDEGVTGVDLADVDADDGDGFNEAWDNSPLRRAGQRGRFLG